MDEEIKKEIVKDEKIKKEGSTEGEKIGCLNVTLVILFFLALIIGIPSCMASKEEQQREAYEASLPVAPTFVSKELVTEKAQQIVGERIELTLGDFFTTTYTIHSIECTDVNQYGSKNENADVKFRAYTYYIDGKLTFTKTDRYRYNYDTNQWDCFGGEWTPENVQINN